jgi:predicted DNA-binding transcriptional regulator AlpA
MNSLRLGAMHHGAAITCGASDLGEFPQPVVLSRDPSGKPRRIAWIDEEIEAFKAAKIAERDATVSAE